MIYLSRGNEETWFGSYRYWILGQESCENVKALNSADLVAVCDVDAERAGSVASQFGVKAYTDSRQMLRDDQIEAVSVCTWSTKLAEEALKALRAGKHVLVEKPMAADTKQAKELIEVAEENELLLTVGFLMRFIPGLEYMKEALQSKKLGKLVCATAKRVSQWPDRIGDVGVVKDTAIHDIDAMRFITGEDPVTVSAKMGSMRHRQFEDYAHIMLTYADGKSAFIESNWITPYKVRSLVATGSDAIMRLDYLTQEFFIESAVETLEPIFPIKKPLKVELEHFVDCVINKKVPKITGKDGLRALQIAEAAMKASATNETIRLEWNT
jgi:UDP-N-acetylglucosamine 3-dehydrogenase